MAIAVTVPAHLKKKPVDPNAPPKRKGWSTPFGFIDFPQPVTYQEACDAIQAAAESINWKE